MGEVLRIDPLNPDRSALDCVAGVIRAGGVIVYPTDTVYGLGCAPDKLVALAHVIAIKRRAGKKGVLLLVPSFESVPPLCSTIPPAFDPLARQFWPGPVTFLLPAYAELSRLISGERGLVGLRKPDSAYLQLLMEMIPGPLVSTSANISGERPSGRVEDLKGQLLDQVDLFVDGGDSGKAIPSTVVDLSVTPPRVVRRGPLGRQVEEAIAKF
jgi:L-threonylcarbamoyladenylate synthase